MTPTSWSAQHVAQAWRMHALGLRAPAEPGIYVVASPGAASAAPPTPLPGDVHLIVWGEQFVAAVGGAEAFARDFAWLPTWEQGFAWLRAQGVPVKHIYYVVKEGVMFYGEDERALLYEEMLRILAIEAGRGRAAAPAAE